MGTFCLTKYGILRKILLRMSFIILNTIQNQSAKIERVFQLLHKISIDDLHDMVDSLAAALDAKNSYTYGHSERVAELSVMLAKQMGLPQTELERIHIGAHLHDIGKIGIPDAILNKPGKLTEAEFAIMRHHPIIGSRIVENNRVLHEIADIVRHHHERYDGRGYPDGLSGCNISLGARIVAVADSFDAMTTIRSYRYGLSIPSAKEELVRCRGTQFDPEVVNALLGLLAENQLSFPNCGAGRHQIYTA